MDTGLAGKTVLITGASRNMGRAAALGFAAEGANLALCTSSRTSEQEAIAEEARQMGVKVVAVKCDITDAAAVSDFVGTAVDAFGSVDVVLNIAGYRCEAPFLEVTEQDWQRTIAVNLTGPFNICRSALPYMIEQRSGRIINFSGVAPYIGGPAGKAMVKLGIVGLTRGLATEFGRYNITANCIGPGIIARDTELTDGVKPMPENLPLQRRGTASNVVSLALYLASRDAGFITGQSYLVNGGAYFS